MSEPLRVFISYSHDSREHDARVVDLSTRLRAVGVDCTIDQYEVSPSESWHRWMDRQIEEADYVLVVCTETYLRRVTGKERPGIGLGVRWESLLWIQDLYDAGSLNEKFVPVLFSKDDAQYIPRPLRGATYVLVTDDEGFQNLHRRLYEVPPAEKPPLGTPCIPRSGQAGFFRPPRNNFTENAVLRNGDFVGRDTELTSLRRQLAEGNVVIYHALSGEGGIGKTELAIEFAYRHGQEFDGLWWIDASNAAIDAQVKLLSASLGLKIPPDATPDQIQRAVCRALSAGRHLLILDNLEERARLDGFILPDPSRVLITTRLHTLPHAHVRELQVNVFRREESVALLRKHRPDLAGEQHTEGLGRVAEHLGDHALAVTLAASYLRKYQSVSPAELLERLQKVDLGDEKHVLEKLYPQEHTAGYRLKVAESLSLHLPEFHGTPGIPILALGSFCHPDDIPVDLFFDVMSPAREETEDWLVKLADVSIIRFEGNVVSIHRLMQEVMRVKLGEQGQRAVLERLVACLGERFAKPEDYRNWAMQDRYALHAEAAVVRAECMGDIRESGYLANQVGGYYIEHARYDAALAAFHAAERIDRAAYGDDHPEVATDVNNIGRVLQDQGDLAGALKCYREAERIDRAALGDDHPNVAIRVNNIGRVLQDQGDLAGALKCYREAERIGCAALGDDHPDVATYVNNVGSVLQDQGDLAGALKCYREAERIARAGFGADHPKVATYVNNIGSVLKAQGDLDGALKCYREAERIDRAALGDDHPKLARDVNNIGGVLQAQGDLEGALKCYRDAERIDRAAFGDDHPNVARDVSNIGGVLFALGDDGGARRIGVEAFGISLRRLGPRALDTLRSARNLRAVGVDPIALVREIAGEEAAEELSEALSESHRDE